MFSYIWPIGLVVLSNMIYHLCAKTLPEAMDPFASLTITYLVGALVSAGFYFLLNKEHAYLRELEKMNWGPVVLGIVIVGLEAGFIFAYKAGWKVSTASMVQSVVLEIGLLLLGILLFKESLSWNKLVGIGICLVGLVFINWK